MVHIKKDAPVAFAAFDEAWGAHRDKALEWLTERSEALLPFYGFPAGLRKHPGTTDVIKSSFATICHRYLRSKVSLANKTALTLIFKLAEATSGADLTFAPHPAAGSRSGCQIQSSTSNNNLLVVL